MSKQYVDVSSWDNVPSAGKQYVDVSNWDKPSDKKGVIDTVVDNVKTFVKDLGTAYKQDQADQQHTHTSAYQHRYEMAGGEELKRKDEAKAYAEHNSQKMEVRKAQLEFTKQPPLQQFQQEILDMPQRALESTVAGIATIPALLVGGEKTAQVVSKAIDTPDKFTKAYPELAMAENIIADPTMIGSKVGAGEKIAETIAQKGAQTGNKIHDAAEDILQSSAQSLGITIERPIIQSEKDESIGKALAGEYTPKAETTDLPKNPPADPASANDTDVATKPDVSDINVGDIAEDPKVRAQVEQDARVQAAHEEAMTRKAELEAQQEAYKNDVDTIESHPRLQELIDMRRDVSAKQSERPNIRESDRQIIHENNGGGYETTVVPARDVKNYDHDFSLTQNDIKSYDKNGITPELADKFKRDLDVLDNNPLYAKAEATPLRDTQVSAAAKIFGEDMAEANMKVIDEIAKAKGVSTDEWLKSTGYKLEDMRHTDYPHFKADAEEADGLFQAKDSDWAKARDEWHKDSHKLTKNADGTPKVFYHGRNVDFEAFNKDYIGHNFDDYSIGFNFSSNPETANHYAKSFGQQSKDARNVMPTYLNIKNPLLVDGSKFASPTMAIDLDRANIRHKLVRAIKDGNPYDGVITHGHNGESNAIAFEPTQIKSIHNNGAFDPKNPNILFQDEKLINGMVSIGINTKGEIQSTIRLFESADFSTLIHESAHVIESQFDDIERAAYNKAFASFAEGKARQEAFAEAFVKYLSEGKAPTEELVGVFEKFKSWLVDMWKVFSTRESEFKLTDEHIDFMRAIMGNKEAAGKIFSKGEREVMSAEAKRADLLQAVSKDATYDEKLKDVREVLSKVDRIKLSPDEKELYDFAMSQKNFVTIFRQSLRNILHKGNEGVGFKHILIRHYGEGAEGEISVWDLLRISKTIKNGDLLTDAEITKMREAALTQGKKDPTIGKNVVRRIIKTKDSESVYYAVLGRDETGGNIVVTYYKTDLTKMDDYPKAPIADSPKAADGYRDHNSQVDNSESVLQKNNDVNELLQEDSRTPQSAGGFYSAAQRAIEKMPPKMESEAFIKYLKNNGVKDDEILYSGIAKAVEGKESITKADIEAAFSNPVMESKTLSKTASDKEVMDFFGIDKETWDSFDYANKHKYTEDMMSHPQYKGNAETKYAQYATKEIGDNYREDLMTLPDSEGSYKSSHWNDKNVLLHTRKQDTVLDGDKTLLVEEIQSDWHQDGRKIGYQSDGNLEAAKKWFDIDTDVWVKLDHKDKQSYYDEMIGSKEYQKKAIPQAPMSKTWHEFGMRQLIDEAVAKGYDRIAWVDGATQTKRYEMSHSVDRLVYNKSHNVLAGYKDGKEVMYKNADEGELEALIGKEPAKRLMENEVHNGIHEIKGEALDIGGDGMKGFYDKILVDYAKKYTKKWGVTVDKQILPNGVEVHTFPVNAKMKEDVSANGQHLYVQGGGILAGVSEDENGNMTFDPLMALAGIAGVSTVMSKSVRSGLSKLVGKSGYLSDATIRGMVRVAIKGADKVTAGGLSKLATSISDNSLVDYALGHKIHRYEDYMKLRGDALKSVNAGMKEAERLHYQLKELSSEAREAMYGYMSGDKAVKLSPELQGAADAFIKRIDDMGQKMVDEGFLSTEAYAEWKGQYLHRRYASKIKGTNDWKSGKGDFSVDTIQARGKKWIASADEYAQLKADGMIGKVSEGKVEADAMVDGRYRLRRDWTPQERKGMGEIRDIAYSLPETYGRMAQMIEFGNMLKSIPDKYIMEQGSRADAVMKQNGYAKITGSRYGALNGKWVNQSIADDIMRVSNDVMGSESAKWFQQYVQAVKKSHTIYNTTAHINNTASGILLQTSAGLNPAKAIMYAAQGARANAKHARWVELDAKSVIGLSAEESKELAELVGDADISLYIDLDKKGLFGRSQLNDMLNTYMAPMIEGKAESMIGTVARSMEKLYQAEDDIMRFAAVKQLMNDGTWVREAKGSVEKKFSIDEAIEFVNKNIIPDYSAPMSKLALTLRDSGIVPFMSWMYHSTPILMHQIKDHPSRMVGIIGAWIAVDEAFGVNPFNEKEIPQDGFASQRIIVARDGDKVTGMRISSMVPQTQLSDVHETYWRSLLLGGIPQTAFGASINQNFYYNTQISQKNGAGFAYDMAENVVKNVLPSPDILDRVYDIAKAHIVPKEIRKNNRVYEPRTPAQEAASLLVNLRTYDMRENKSKVEHEKIKGNKKDKKGDEQMRRAADKLFGWAL